MSNKAAVGQIPQTITQEMVQKVHQLMLDDYEAACREWEEEREAILHERDTLLESELEMKRQMLQNSTEREFRQKQEELRGELNDCTAQKTSAEAKLAALGFFAFGEKCGVKKTIRALARQIAALEGSLKANEASYQEQLKRDRDTLNEFRASRQMEINRQHPIPPKPGKPPRMLCSNEPMTDQKRENMRIQQEILAFMEEGRPYGAADIIKECPECANMTNQRVSALLRGLIPEYVERIEDRRTAYYIRIKQVPGKEVFAVKQQAFAPGTSPVQTTNSAIKQGILDFMVHGNLYCVSELLEQCPACAGLPNQRVSAMLRQLREESKLERVETVRKVYFYRID